VRYQGEFRAGKKEGWGRWDDHDRGISYEGCFKEDRPHGIGYLNLQAQQVAAFMAQEKPIEQSEKIGKRYAGEWANGRIQGNGKLATSE
jgi:hypothetical protein